MSLENEYVHWKQLLENEKKSLAKFESLDVTQMDEMQIEARNRGIANCKESIEEYSEIFEEIKEELNEFIKNGGEVSQLTIDELKEETNEFEEVTVNFKILSNKNENVYCEGYVTINDEDGEDVDWYFWNGNVYQSSPFFQHDEETIKGLTIEQNRDIDTFKEDYSDDALWIDTCIIQSDESENKTYIRENCTLIINDGAKFEVEYEDYTSHEWDAQYYMAFTLKFNGDIVSLDEDVFWEDPFTYEQFQVKDILHENEAYIVEVPKTIWEDPDEIEMNEKIMEELCDSFLYAYKKSLVCELGVFGIAYRISKSLEDGEVSESDLQNSANIAEQEFEDMDVKELYFMNSDDVEKILKE